MLDAYTAAVAYIVKTYRVAVLWFIMYLVEKVYLDMYLNRVFLQDKKPVSLLSYIWIVMSFENVAFLLMLLVLFLMMQRFKGPSNSFAIDKDLLTALLVDYALSTVLILSLGAAIANVVQDTRLFRYSHDGLRGIRACGELLAQVSLIILVIPFFLVAT